MASISTDANGNRTILFFGVREKREVIYLAKTPLKVVKGIKSNIESLVAGLKANLPMDGQVAQWISGLDDGLRSRLADMQLIERQTDKKTTTLGEFIDSYHAKRTDWKPNSLKNHQQCKGWILDYFGSDRNVREITTIDADDFRRHLSNHLAEDWVRRLCGFARQYFSAMGKMIESNPFGKMKNIAMKGNDERYFFMDNALTMKVMQAMADDEWRLVFGLCRYAGFRCPSEHGALHWHEIDWKKGKITFISPKTGKRSLPLFPELIPLLKAMPKKGEKVFPDYTPETNLRHHFMCQLLKAKIEPWPKIFQNLRSTRETELMETFPAHVVCAWLGNTEAVAKKHYLQVTDDHFRRATAQNTEQKITLDSTSRVNAKITKTTKSRDLVSLQISSPVIRREEYTQQESRNRKSMRKTKDNLADRAEDRALSDLLGF
jgi:integrase